MAKSWNLAFWRTPEEAHEIAWELSGLGRRAGSPTLVRVGDQVHIGAITFGQRDQDEARSILDEEDGTNFDSDYSTRDKETGKQLAELYGWTGANWMCLDQLWTGESGWNHLAVNPTSGAYGIPQALPPSKMAKYGGDFMTNPVTQIRWGLDYISTRYKTPCAAYAFWLSHWPHWY